MGDLISREDTLAAIDAYERMTRRIGIKDDEMWPTLKTVAAFVQALPAVDAEPVRRGQWINRGYVCGEYEWECSVCGESEWRGSTIGLYYCPNCGAKMDGDDK